MAGNRAHSICNRALHGTSTVARALAFVCAGVVLLCACEQEGVKTQSRLAEGRAFPEIALNSFAGNTVSTHSFRGKVLILNFWATWCPPCRREMPSLERLSKMLDPNKFEVVGVSIDEDPLLAEEFLRQNQITFANYLDRGGKSAKQLGVQVFPETFLITPDGILRQRVPGLQDWSSSAMIAQLEEIQRNSNIAGIPNGDTKQR